MGQDKALLAFRGTTLLGHSLGVLRGLGFTTAVAGFRPGREHSGSIDQTTSILADRFIESGPLGGIEAALRSLQEEAPQAALFIAVDLPHLPAALLEMLWQRAQITGALVTVPYFAGRPQPLCAVYHSSLATGIAEALAGGDRKVMRVLQHLAPSAHFDQFRVEALPGLGQQAAIDQAGSPMYRWFANVNTPADWQAVHGTFEQSERHTGPAGSIS